MGFPQEREDDDELLELPPGSLEDGEAVGVDDSDALTDAEIEGGPEDVGLDTEELGGGALEDELDYGEDEESQAEGGAPADTGDAFDDQLDDADENERWTEESEGAPLGFDDEIADEPLEQEDDGGLEGVDDPLLVALEKDGELPALDGDDDEDDEEDDDSELAALILELEQR